MAQQTREAFQEVVVGIPSKMDATVFAQNSFFFQQRRGKLDMRSLARVDIERVIEECDVGTLQVHLENLTFSDLSTDDMVSYTDDHFLKLFRLSQLTIEYLLNVQNALLTYSRSVEEETERLKAAADEGDRRLKARHSKVHSLKRSLKQQRQTLKTYEALLKQQQQQPAPARQNQAPSPGGGNIMTANDGTTYVSVDYLKRKAKNRSNSRDNSTAAAKFEAELLRKKQDEANREWKIKFEQMQQQLMASTKNQQESLEKENQSLDLANKLQSLEQEKQKREESMAQQLEQARLENERKVEDVRREITEQMRSMKTMMEAELRDQRTLAEQRALDQSSSVGASGAAGRTNAGDMESDSDDELHDRESMGSMRRSKRELAKMVTEQQLELEALRAGQTAMRDSMIAKYISAKDRGRATTYKTIAMDGWKEYVQMLKHERTALSLRVQNESMHNNQTVEEEEEEEEGEEEEEEEIVTAVVAPKTRPARTGTLFMPTYQWQKCPLTSKLPYEDQLDIEEKVNDQGVQWEEVRIPPMWELTLRYDHHSGNSDTATIRINISVHRAMLVRDILLKCVEKLKNDHGIETVTSQDGARAGSLSLVGTYPGSSGAGSGSHHHGHLLSSDESSTVDSNHMFVYRPRLVLFSGMTDAKVNEIVVRFEKHVDERLSKNKNRLKKNVRKYMELQDEAIMDELTKAGKLTDEYIASLMPPLKGHNSTQFQSVKSRALHDENEIDMEQNEILGMIKDELVSMGIKKTRKKDGSGKKKIRGLSQNDFEMLMEDTEWHLSGQSWPTTRAATPQDMTSAIAYFQACVEAEQARAMEDVAGDIADERNEILEQRRTRTKLLTSLLSTAKDTKMTPAQRKQAIKQMMNKLHGHYFSKLFNVLQPGSSSAPLGTVTNAGTNRGESKTIMTTNAGSDAPTVPTGRPSPTSNSANLLRQSATVNFMPSISTGNGTEEEKGEEKEVEPSSPDSSRSSGMTRRTVPEPDDSMNDSSINDQLNGTWDEDQDVPSPPASDDGDDGDEEEAARIARLADQYEQQGGMHGSVGSVGSGDSLLNTSVQSLGRGGASPGARRERTTGASSGVLEDLENSWDMDMDA